MRRTRAENAKFVIDCFRQLEIPVHPLSRLMRMYQILTRSSETIAAGTLNFEIAVETVRDMQVLGFIFDQAMSREDREAFRAIVRRTVKDSPLPQEDRGQSTGRVRQFELLVAAICQNGAMEPVDYREPDVTCSVAGVRFGIAAKRVKSFDRLEARIKDAAEQIERAGRSGIIAIDITSAANPENKRICEVAPSDLFANVHRQCLCNILKPYEKHLKHWVAG